MDPFSFPQRVVLLIDLHPINTNPNPNSYISPILASVSRLLSFPPLSQSLFAFNLFFSSLSPVLSESKLHPLLLKPPSSLLSFDRPSQTLASLSQTLNLASSSPLEGPSDPLPSPTLHSLARFLLRLEHDYSWEPATAAAARRGNNPLTLAARSNLVLLFSPAYTEYLDPDGSFRSFHNVLGPVSDRFVSRDIHFSWIDANFDGHSGSGFLERGIRELNWGFCSTDAVLLGSALIPFSLLFPYIGCTMGFWSDSGVKKGRAELVLAVTDVSGEPLECKSCDLEVVDLNLVEQRLDFGGLFSNNSDGQVVKLRVINVWRKDEDLNFVEKSCRVLLLRGVSGECSKEPARAFFADRVLELLCTENGEIAEGSPIWQLLLAFLFNNSYWALVSLSDSDGNSLEGILMPFTVNYALLSIVEKNSLRPCQLAAKDYVENPASTLTKIKGDRRKRNKVQKKIIQNVTWSSFYEAAIMEHNSIAPVMDLCEVYFAMECSLSKKMRFLKCWMRQIQKSSDCFQFKLSESEEPLNLNKEKLYVVSQKDPIIHIPSPARERHLNGSANEKPLSFSCLEDVEAFIGSVPQKMEHGLHSEEVDLWHLATRLIGLSIDAFYFKLGLRSIEDQASEEAKGTSDPKVAAEVSRLLFLKPKDLTSKYKSFSSAPLTSDQSKVAYNTEHKIREHELQILFRMEVLKSELAATLEENAKQKMVKEICSLLQNIDFSLQGDSFSGESLLEFAGRTIKSRYSNSLGDIIRKIYEHMEFFSFDEDEVDASDSLPVSNSDEPHRVEDENDNAPRDSVNRKLGATANAHEIMLLKAQKQRERARRLASFTSWVPDLHRVWAFKQPRAEKTTHESLPKSKSKKRRRRESKGEMVCETPLTGKKHSHVREEHSGSNPCKALFQHEDS